MRMIVPPIANRREIDRNLVRFFNQHSINAFRRALSDFCRYYNVKRPRIEWFEYIDWGKTAGKTFEDGRIHLVHPENWKRGRVYNRERMWVQMVYHEMAHYLFWTDAERKADAFAVRMVRGLRRLERRSRSRAGARTFGRAPGAASRGRSSQQRGVNNARRLQERARPQLNAGRRGSREA